MKKTTSLTEDQRKSLTLTGWLATPFKSPRERRQEKLGPVPHVHVRGEALSEPIHWLGKQWAVTSFGLERRDGTYAIAKERLWENEGVHGWYAHMATTKDGIDLPDFAQCLCEARYEFRDLYPGRRKGGR